VQWNARARVTHRGPYAAAQPQQFSLVKTARGVFGVRTQNDVRRIVLGSPIPAHSGWIFNPIQQIISEMHSGNYAGSFPHSGNYAGSFPNSGNYVGSFPLLHILWVGTLCKSCAAEPV
jgi:hypothetical protein